MKTGSLNRTLMGEDGLVGLSKGRKENASMALVVTIQKHLHHGAVLADRLHGRVTEILVGDAQDQFVDEARVVVKSILDDC
jgi:hypothetical protein